MNRLVLVAAVAASAPVWAESGEHDDLALVYGDRVTVSIATGSLQPVRRAPAVATAITAEQIAAMGARDLDEVLESAPGIHVSRSNSLYAPIWVVRGIFSTYNPQILLLHNGVPMTTMFVGNKGNIWGGYPVHNISRIEIIRGPGSALYGADAYAGVINIITKAPGEAIGTTLGMQGGSFGTRDAWLRQDGSLGAIASALYLRVGGTDGFKRTVSIDAQTRTDFLFGTRASLAPGAVNVGHDAVDAQADFAYAKWRASFSYKQRENVGTGAGVNSALDPWGTMKSERVTSSISWTDMQVAPDWGVGVTASYLHYKQLAPDYLRLFPPGTAFSFGSFPDGMLGAPQTWEKHVRLSAFANYSGFAGHRVRFGVGHDDLNLYRTEEYKNFFLSALGVPIPAGPIALYTGAEAFMLPQRRRVNYLYVQDEWALAPDWTLTAGVRNDRYSDFGSTTNPRLALVWDASLDVTAKLLYGHAFRAPAFNEQYSINNPVVRGNENLKPETIQTFEASVDWAINPRLHANVSVFRYERDDIIRTVPNAIPGTGSTYRNTGRQDGSGVEVELKWEAARHLNISGNYSYQRSIDKATNADPGYAPRHHLYARADWRVMTGLTLGGQVNHVARRKRPVGDNRPAVADYTTVDLTMRTEPGRYGWAFAATVRNLFNADVREPSLAPGLALPNDLPMAPRAAYLQATYHF